MNDPEITAMGTISAALDTLDEPARERVLRWARDRYSVAKSAPARDAAAWTVGVQRGETLPREQLSGTFLDIAAVYSAANPTSDTEKVLVVGYFFQVVRGETELDSQTLNTELKNLGYPIGNVTRAVTGLATSVPRYVVQTKKAGSTKQARKKFRLTHEGIRRVEQMLGAAVSGVTRHGGDAASSVELD